MTAIFKMEFEFDNEIDAILRKARTDNFASAVNPKSAHLDADEISAFAENALPEKTKTIYTQHLADCGRCRKILSNIISPNSEAESETASSAAALPENSFKTSIPWYRKLFLFPQLTYIMGASVLVFGGFLAYSVIQNPNKSAETSSISQAKERLPNLPDAGSDGNAAMAESSRVNSNAGAMRSNTAANSAANVPSPAVMSNSTATSSNASAADGSVAPRKEPSVRRQDEKAAPPTAAAKDESENAAGGAAASAPPPAVQTQPSIFAQKKPEQSENSDKAKTAEMLRESKKNDSKDDALDDSTAETRASRSASAPKPAAKNAVNGETKQADGKNFTRKNGVWYDANYNGQSTTNVSRNSDDYRKLDRGLRSIADGLSGTVIVVWKNKAYRIQ